MSRCHTCVARLRRVEGQIRGLQHMVERGENCSDIMVQIAAARAALAAVALELIACEMSDVVMSDDRDQRAALASDIHTAIERIAHR